MKTSLFLVAVAAVSLTSLSAHAQILNFSVPGSSVGGSTYAGLGAAPDLSTYTYWNTVNIDGTTSGDFLSDGTTASAITLTDSSPAHYGPGGQANPPTVPSALFNPYALENNGSTVTDTLSNVGAGTYNLYLYGDNASFSDRGTIFSVGSTSLATLNTTDASFIRGNNYVEFTNISLAAPGTISFSYTANPAGHGGSNSEGDFNGLQLQVVPEPGTYALFAAALAVLFFYRRSGRA